MECIVKCWVLVVLMRVCALSQIVGLIPWSNPVVGWCKQESITELAWHDHYLLFIFVLMDNVCEGLTNTFVIFPCDVMIDYLWIFKYMLWYSNISHTWNNHMCTRTCTIHTYYVRSSKTWWFWTLKIQEIFFSSNPLQKNIAITWNDTFSRIPVRT